MAQSGYTPISLYYSTTASATPSAGNLVAGELALNTLDEKLYFKNSSGTVKLLASSAASATTGTNAQLLANNGSGGFSNVTVGSGISYSGGTLSATGTGGTVTSVALSGGTTGLTVSGSPITTSGTITLAGTLAVANGGTGVTSLTANNVILGNGTSAVQFVSPGAAGNLLVSDGTTWTSASASGGVSSGKAYFFSSFN